MTLLVEEVCASFDECLIPFKGHNRYVFIIHLCVRVFTVIVRQYAIQMSAKASTAWATAQDTVTSTFIVCLLSSALTLDVVQRAVVLILTGAVIPKAAEGSVR